jgi:hypothetical protein
VKRLLAVIAGLLALASAGAALAQGYPARPITMIVPFPAGGATDTLARFMAEQMRGILGQPVIIENIAGAAGSIGVGRAVRSAADGYTLSIGTSTTHMLTGGLYALPFDLLNDLEPIIQIGSEPLLIVGKKSLPADDLNGLIAYLKANPDKASVGVAGVGATGHLTGVAFQNATGTRFQFVPYRGNAPAMQDLLAEQIDFMIEPSSNFKSLLGTGSVKLTRSPAGRGCPRRRRFRPPMKPGCPASLHRSGTGFGSQRTRQRRSSPNSMPPWCKCLPIPWWRSALSCWASRSRRWRSNRRKRCGLSRKPRPSAGGRSSRHPASR